MITISVKKQFASRDELDTYVRTTFGENIEKNREVTLEAPAEELQALSLSNDTHVLGVKISEAAVSEEVNTK